MNHDSPLFIPEIQSVHGQNPQSLIEKIVRDRIKDSIYWKEECFGINAATLIDKAIKLEYIGGVYGGTQKPTPFICLLFRMLQIQPDMNIILEFIHNSDIKYLRALGIVYFRFVASAIHIYETLEPLLQDYRKLRERTSSGEFIITHMDELVDRLLHDDKIFNLVLPRIPKRFILEKTHQLAAYISPIAAELDEDGAESIVQ